MKPKNNLIVSSLLLAFIALAGASNLNAQGSDVSGASISSITQANNVAAINLGNGIAGIGGVTVGNNSHVGYF